MINQEAATKFHDAWVILSLIPQTVTGGEPAADTTRDA
jgi:hypothetical protein